MIGPIVTTAATVLRQVPIIGDVIAPFAAHGAVKIIDVTVEPTAGQDLSFGPDFHWGVATGSFQSEMAVTAPNDVNSDEWVFLHDAVNKLIGAAPGLPEDGPDGWDMYETDAELAAEDLGVDTFRTGIEWSRIFPNSTASVDASDGISDEEMQTLEGLADPARSSTITRSSPALHAQGLDPMVTINHYTLPTWVNDPTISRPGRAATRTAGVENGSAGSGHRRRVPEVRRVRRIRVQGRRRYLVGADRADRVPLRRSALHSLRPRARLPTRGAAARPYVDFPGQRGQRLRRCIPGDPSSRPGRTWGGPTA